MAPKSGLIDVLAEPVEEEEAEEVGAGQPPPREDAEVLISGIESQLNELRKMMRTLQ